MHRIFLGLAVADGTLLVAALVLGFVNSGVESGTRALLWHRAHFATGLAATMATLLVHSIAYTYFLGTGKWVREVVRVYRMPAWVEGQATRNKRKAFPFALWGMILVGGTAWLGAAADTRRGFDPAWHLGLAAVALAFNLGAFAAEYTVIVAQARLLLEVKDRADRMRKARVAAEAVELAGPDPS